MRTRSVLFGWNRWQLAGKNERRERKKEEADWTVKWKRLRGVVFDVECVVVSLEFKSNRSRAPDTSSGNTKKIHRELIGPVSSNLTSFALFFFFLFCFSTRYSSRKRTGVSHNSLKLTNRSLNGSFNRIHLDVYEWKLTLDYSSRKRTIYLEKKTFKFHRRNVDRPRR